MVITLTIRSGKNNWGPIHGKYWSGRCECGAWTCTDQRRLIEKMELHAVYHEEKDGLRPTFAIVDLEKTISSAY